MFIHLQCCCYWLTTQRDHAACLKLFNNPTINDTRYIWKILGQFPVRVRIIYCGENLVKSQFHTNLHFQKVRLTICNENTAMVLYVVIRGSNIS